VGEEIHVARGRVGLPGDPPHAGPQAAGIQLEGFAEIGRRLHELRMPVRIIEGRATSSCPTWPTPWRARVERDLPQAVATALPDCGHLHQEAPQQVGELLAPFLAEAA
jgi:pimeloyl-ACP methyl ester carboxylesterase